MIPKKAFISEEEYNRRKKEIEDEKGYSVCGYPIQTSTGVHLCRQPAGHGTEHLGEGRCRDHGGAGGRIKSGMYSGFKSSPYSLFNLIKKYEAQVNWQDLSKELASARSILSGLLNRVGEGDPADVAAVLATLKTVADLVEKRIRIDERQNYSMEDVKEFLRRIVAVIDAVIKDVRLKKTLFTELQKVRLTRTKEKEK